MTVTALIMAGGKGTRMALKTEKPLILVGGNPVIDHVLYALQNAKTIDNIAVAITDNTPNTTQHLQTHFPQITVVKTPGKEYVSDMGNAVKQLNLQTVMAIAADLPLITSQVIDEIITAYYKCNKPTLAVAVPQETKRKLGMGLGYAFEHDGQQVVPAGINIIDGTKIDDGELEQAVYITDKPQVAVNINTTQELQIAQNLTKNRQ
ncbi:MAG: NTP transferase domain-containing protein [Candidatus Bathyarchaeota archaeon]|nr:NTP transferase domain-containing protein [Candidatus Bathyarchaeota archaeon]